MVSGQRTRIFSYDIQLRSELSHSVSLELVVYLVSSQFSEFQVRRRHVMAQEPPRPVGPRGEEKARPSISVLQQFSSTRVLQFNKCYVGNAIHRRLHCVVFSTVHPQRCKG